MLRPTFNNLSKISTRNFLQISTRSATTLTNASITNLESRWEKLPESDKKYVIEALSEKQKLPWKELSQAEKKASWYISFGEWGPRKPVHTKDDVSYIFWGVTIGLGISASIFLFFRSIRNVPKTMNKEWQAQSDEYLKSKNANPFTGYSQVQSK
ncbi:unnamed protein product [[Candida] boidinii]|uniref:Unnamed protein product n=1 Tax=Candida boidinii TaxID=5477 RepID=A0A9W6WAS0_CANBO|nr:hypothetical protein B5S30_g4009 [[Candida] boidinii]GME72745.1 unnamed protein product [[Candida] boidinii]GMF98753.1 unnamed protein product [[Candida] boidinii]